ncbi:hypothetical protein, partial [Pseudomonas viridiflava]|uniref:hypothetical protein n=1 Tax=Pseudomonas viridiflava TaxID=33069 RepID=UPI0019CFE98E
IITMPVRTQAYDGVIEMGAYVATHAHDHGLAVCHRCARLKVLDQVTRIALSWKDDDWAAFISETQLAMTSLIKVLHQSGRFLPNKVQKAVDIGLWLARMISHLMMLRTLWN